ncbi:MAG: hypothetical protein IJT52_00790 [Spirochaetales bacterium]|nr:hypothetical protein [Spirochaetales bacterium]
MNKAQLSALIKSRIDSLDSSISRIEKLRLDETPSDLVISSVGGKARFYKVLRKDGGRKYISDKSEVTFLAQKRYLECLKVAAQRERRQMELCLAHLQKEVPNSDVERVFDSLPDPLKPFVKPDIFTDEGYAAAWQSKKVICGRKTSSHTIKTLRGDYVRSKSEALLADRFFVLGIPYRYEQRFVIDEMTEFYLHPDFTVLNKRTRKEYYWEHCGMIDDSKYGNDAVERLYLYSLKGYYPGKNMIFTYETKEKPLNMDYVDKLISEYLL